jgi:signal transduction histidine kinase
VLTAQTDAITPLRADPGDMTEANDLQSAFQEPATSWPGALVERALAALSADYRRPTGPTIVALVLAATALAELRGAQGPITGFPAVMLSLGATVPVAVIRRWPGAAIACILVANSLFIVADRLSWPVAAMAGWVIALAASPLLLPRRAAVWVLPVSEAVVLLAPLQSNFSPTPWDATMAEALAVVAAWGTGELILVRRQSAAERAQAAERMRSLNERDALARERAAIARELHDVVAHQLSMIAVRAGTTPYAAPAMPPQYRAVFEEIASDARTALAELRVVLGVLRDPDALSAATPQPGIADVRQLLDRVRGTGVAIDLHMRGASRPLPASAELCAFRVVQEAVTNAGRHAPGSAIQVNIQFQPAELEITVRNGPPELWSLAAAREASSPGFGLVGLRERVGLLGGRFEAGPDGHGGFAVTAALPAGPGRAELEARSA